MGDKATLRMARQELEDLYLGVPDDSVDLTFRDFAFKPAIAAAPSSRKPLPAVATATSTNFPNNAVATADHVSVDRDDADAELNKIKQTTTSTLARSSTNIFTYRPLDDHEDVSGGQAAAGGGGLAGVSSGVLAGGAGAGSLAGAGAGGARGLSSLQLPPIPASPVSVHFNHSDDDEYDDYADHQYNYKAADAGTTTTTSRSAAGDHHQTAGGRRSRRSHVANDAMEAGRDRRAARSSNNHYRRPGIPHSNICALCNSYVYVFRHRCLVCGRVYCRRCVGAGMGDMTEGRKCIDCLGRRYSHRYIHRAGDTGGGCGLCFWGNAKAVTAQELIWAEKGPAPRRRPRPNGLSSISTSYGGGGDGGYYSSTNTVASASMSMTMNSDSSITMMRMNGGQGRSISGRPASASSSFVAAFPNNPHALPL